MIVKDCHDEAVLELERSELRPPPMFKVILLNDDFTPMDFVVKVLQIFFSMSQEQAIQVMLQIHTDGIGICGIYFSDIAITKVRQVIEFSRHHEHPLKCVMEGT